MEGRENMEANEKSILSVKELCLWYGNHQALKNINIDIPKNSITALIGPSGCGKSTFLKTLDRMNDLIPDVKITGSVEYKGEDIFAPGVDVSELRRQIGMVFQKPNPFPMSIYDNIAYGPRTHGIRNRAKLDDIVEKSLRGAAIWDEVKDPISTSKIEELAMQLKEQYTIVIVTHNMQQAVRISDNTAFFLLGELVEYGKTEEMFSQPTDKRTEDYITGRFG